VLKSVKAPLSVQVPVQVPVAGAGAGAGCVVVAMLQCCNVALSTCRSAEAL
jgi:hypothetical protein